MKNPLVSIIMATFNRSQLIVESLEAIQQQTYQNWECLIIDDGSTDTTARVVHEFIKSDNRFNYFKRKAEHLKGLPGCRNTGLALAKGKYVIFFDDDDIPHPMNLKLCVNYLSSDSFDFCRYQRAVFTGEFDYLYDTSQNFNTFEIDGRTDLYKMLSHELPFNSCAIMWKKEVFENNRFEESLMYAEEWECYSRILSKGAKGISLDKTLFFARKHPQSNTGEFYSGNRKRYNSKINAIKLVIENIDRENLFDQKLARLFCWMSYTLRSKKVFSTLMKVDSLSTSQKGLERLRYYFAPMIERGMKLKKNMIVSKK